MEDCEFVKAKAKGVIDSNDKQIDYFLLIYLDLDLVQYLHGNAEEEKYTNTLIKIKENFQNNENIGSNIQRQY